MKQSIFNIYPKTFIIIVLLLTAYCLPLTVSAQEDEPPPDLVPPPLKMLSKDEQKILNGQNDVKKRVKISLELMDARILKAEKFKTEESFKETLAELSGFHAILDNTLNFLVKSDNDKIDKRFITFEIYLRKQIPRLEVIRREIPHRYGWHVGKLMKAVREARAKAVEPIFSDTVVPDKKKPDEN